MDRNDDSMDQEWTPEEKAAFAALPEERAPTPELKRRTIAAARAAGLVAPSRRGMGARMAVLLVAASLVFAAGTLVGYALAQRRPAAVKANAPSREAVASMHDLKIVTDSTRRIIWY